MRAPRRPRRKRVIAALTAALAGGLIAVAAAGASPANPPGPVTGLTSSTHPLQTTWYANSDPSFSWNPNVVTGNAIVGYSIRLDNDVNGVPDAVTDRNSIDFKARVPYTIGSQPTEDRIADFDADGKLDIAAENSNSNTVSILIGKGDGTFKAKADYGTGGQPWSMDVGDVSGDGSPDIVVANHTANTASVLINKGNGTFRAKVDYTTGNTPESLKLGDVNGDGRLDIVVCNAGANTVSVLTGKGDGTFNAKSDFSTGTHPTSISLADFNGDGKLDIVAANYDGNNVSVLTGRGNGTFNTHVDYATGAGPETVDVADLNADGKIDVATVNGTDNTASVLLNTGSGALAAKVDYTVGALPYALDILDLNQDGAPDLVTTNHNANTVSILFGSGDGTFLPKDDKSTGNGPFWVALGDFNGDGYGDLAVTDMTDGKASVMLGTAFLAASYTGQADGIWYFHVRAVDSTGTAGPTTTRAVRIDVTAPVSSVSGVDSDWHDSAVTATFAATDPSSGVASTQYSTNGGTTWTTGTSFTVQAPSDGSNDGPHVIRYRSTDVAGNVETARSCTVNIVTSAPTTTVSGADAAWHASPVDLTFASGSYGVTGTEYSLDGGTTWIAGTSLTIPAPPDGSNDGAHTVLYRSTNGAGLVEAVKSCTVKIDVGAPTTTVSGADGLWHDSDVTLTFSGSDAGSGVAATEYSTDGGATWTTGTSLTVQAPANGANDGSHTVLYRSTDAAGHTESPARSCTVNIDGGAPTTTVSGADGAWHDSDVVLHFSGSDAGSGVATTEYSTDGGATWTTGTALTVAAPADGSNDGAHTVLYRSVDALGHAEGAHGCAVRIDTQAPVTTQTGADGAWHDTDVTVSFAATDTGSGVDHVEYSTDGGATWTTGTSVTITAAPDGSNDGVHAVSFRAIDTLGHVEDAQGVAVRIDTNQPVTADNAAGAWHAVPFTLLLTATDVSGTTTQYSIGDDQHWQTGTAVVFGTSWRRGGGSGPVTVYYRSTDGAGHVEATRSCVVLLDTSRPVTRDDAPAGAQSADVTVHLTCRDTFSGWGETWYQVDGGQWQTGTSVLVPAPIDHGNDGRHTIKYFSLDKAGNAEAGYRVCMVTIATP